MNKIISIIILAMMLIATGCKAGVSMDTEPNESRKISFQEGVYEYKDWDKMQFPVNHVAIPDMDTAVSVATGIFKSLQKDGKFPDYKAQDVFYDTEDEIWIVYFWEDWENDDGTITLGSDCAIALQKSDAKVMCIWVEE